MATISSLIRTPNASIEQEHLDRCTALMLGCAAGQRPLADLMYRVEQRAGPVMAGMMAGYVDVPVTCLTAMLQDKERGRLGAYAVLTIC